MMKKVFLCWKSACTRSRNQAYHFGAKNIYILLFPGRRGLAALFVRYLGSFVITLQRLIQERPDVIFTLNQPPFLILAVYLYASVFRCKYILDSHSAAFNDKKWAWARPLYRFIARRAFLNINTNEHHRQLVESWGGKSIVMSDIPIDYDRHFPPQRVDRDSIAVVASFMFDEPIEAIWAAARKTPEIHYYVTGDEQKLTAQLRNACPTNIHLTGYLSTEDYLGLLTSVRGVMVLTTRNHTMQMGAYEALSLQQPIITSNWPILRESFGPSAVYVDNNPASIAAGARELMGAIDAFKAASIAQRVARRAYYDSAKQQILTQLKT